MIQKRTVFVLGAGASMPYGFPSGQALRHEICTQTLRRSHPYHTILSDMGYSRNELEACQIALSRSWASSIDMFIASRADHAAVAKAAIALTIAKYESNEKLFFANPKGDWFRYLWQYLHKPNGDQLPKDHISFVTFNYDRTLEHALANGLRHAKNVPELTSKLLPDIVHVYGSLGKYPFQDISDPTRDFETQSDHKNIKQSQNSINVISEKDQSSEYPKQAQDLLEKADQIFFLGFGYDEDNLRVLRLLQGNSCLSPSCRAFGTAMGLNPQERSWVQSELRWSNSTHHIGLAANDVDCLMFLREHRSHLSWL